MFPSVTRPEENAPAAELHSLLNPLPWILTTREQEHRLLTKKHRSVRALGKTHCQIFATIVVIITTTVLQGQVGQSLW